MSEFPHQMSGGMRQRAVGAIALSGGPELIIADEPTTNLDVTIQAQYLNMLKDLQRRTGVALLFITHNLGIVAKMCDRVAVMYAGRIVEQGPVREIYNSPRHPVHEGAAQLDPEASAAKIRSTPSPASRRTWPRCRPGCSFHPRCTEAWERCRTDEPRDFAIGEQHRARCWLVDEATMAERRGRAPIRSSCRRTGAELAPSPTAGWSRYECRRGEADARSSWPDEVLSRRRRDRRLAVARLGQGRRRHRLHDRRRRDARAWSASPAAARPRRPRCCCCWSDPRPARSSSRAATSRSSRARICWRTARPSRRCSRTRTARSARGMRVGDIIGEPLEAQGRTSAQAIRDRVGESLELVGLRPEQARLFPHEFSGGQRQRIAIARAIATNAAPDHPRRAGLGAGRLDPGADHDPARGPPAAARRQLPVHRA